MVCLIWLFSSLLMFVKCPCEKCGGHLEFDQTNNGRLIQCPHCGQSTTLVVLTFYSRTASPKQVACLKFHGFTNVGNLSVSEAGALIDNLSNADSLEDYEKMCLRHKQWLKQRFILYPELYEEERETEVFQY